MGRVDSSVLLVVSPTYLSSDLLTPHQTKRATFPSIGVFKSARDDGYRSINGCPIHSPSCGLPQQHDKLITQQHVGNDVFETQTNAESRGLTSILLRSSRINDQLLPQPLHTALVEEKKISAPWPHVMDKYFTHTPHCEVFPQTNIMKNCYEESLSTCFTSPTQKALQEYMRKLYGTRLYCERFENMEALLPELITKNREMRQFAKVNNQGDDKRGRGDDTFLSGPEARETLNQPTETAVKPNNVLDEPDERNTTPMKERCCPIHGNTVRPLANEHGTTTFTGVSPCWPPSFSSVIRKLRTPMLMERPTVTTYPPALCSFRLDCTCVPSPKPNVIQPDDDVDRNDVDNEQVRMTLAVSGEERIDGKQGNTDNTSDASSEKQMETQCRDHAETPSSIDDIRSKISSAINILESIKLPVMSGAATNSTHPQDPVLFNEKPLEIARDVVGKRLPELRNPLLSTEMPRALPPTALADCLHPTGNRVADKLGLSYKTEAHRRFHAMYLDPIADLRKSRTKGKRYFFYGYHSSAFRG